jgi:predicted dienelactone hydrolase
MRTRSLVVMTALLVLAAACGGDDGGQAGEEASGSGTVASTTTTIAVPARAEVEHLTLDLVDTSRPTPANGPQQPATDQRDLTTEVYVPAGTGPFPLIAFSHGWAGHPRKFTELFQAWAEAGYVVAAPAFPISNDQAPGGAESDDLPSQPGDISFVIDEVLGASEDPSDPLFGSVDPDHIGVAGMSLGGATTYGVAFADCCRDDRVTAAAILDGALGFDADMASGLPLLVMHADEDYLVPYAPAIGPYHEAVAPKWLVTIHEAVHFEPYEDTPDPADDMVRAATIAFWDRYLGGDESAEQRLVDAVQPADLASLDSEPS